MTASAIPGWTTSSHADGYIHMESKVENVNLEVVDAAPPTI